MKTAAECLACFLNQSQLIFRQVNTPEEQRYALLLELIKKIPELDHEASPAENSSILQLWLYQQLGNADPYAAARSSSNQAALALYPELCRRVRQSAEPLPTAIAIAAAGNIVDLGIFADYDLQKSLEEALTVPLARFDYQQFRAFLQPGCRVLMLGDNSGEIVFDRVLAEQLAACGCKVTYAVKEAPICNDVTWDDARQSGIDQVARVISNGSPFMGTLLERCSPQFLQELAQADVVISKGQANYETLGGRTEAGTKTFFILRAKCQAVAASLQTAYFSLVFVQNKPE